MLLRKHRPLFSCWRTEAGGTAFPLWTFHVHAHAHVHDYAHAHGHGHAQDTLSSNIRIAELAKRGFLGDARSTFESMAVRDVVSWTSIIGVYARIGDCEEALRLFRGMGQEGAKPNRVTFIHALHACSQTPQQGKLIHANAVADGFDRDVSVGTALLKMYAEFRDLESARSILNCLPHPDVVSWTSMAVAYAQNGQLHSAHELFDGMPSRNVISWTALITSYARSGHDNEAFQLFWRMLREGTRPNKITFSVVLDLDAGLNQHKTTNCIIASYRLDADIGLGTSLIRAYGKSGNFEDARRIFDRMMPESTVVSWIAMIEMYKRNGLPESAIKLLEQTIIESVMPFSGNTDSVASILNACASMAALKQGKSIHSLIASRGIEVEAALGTALVKFYCKCQSLMDARRTFDRMPQQQEGEDIVIWNTLIGAYVQSRCLKDAESLFWRMPRRDVVSWNTMISGNGKNQQGRKAMELFKRMHLEGMAKPDDITMISVLDVCASLSALAEGKLGHALAVQGGHESKVIMGNALVNMYGKCGNEKEARRVFNRIPLWRKQAVVSWTSMIAAYARNGQSQTALSLLKQMESQGVKPDKITFVSILHACSHAGLLEEGRGYFASMCRDHGITPMAEHYICMADLLARSGLISEAEDMIGLLPFEPPIEMLAVAWRCLLSACRACLDTERAAYVAEHLFELDPKDSTAYVLLSNIYSALGRWDDVAKVMRAMKEKAARQSPGHSYIEVRNKVHEFVVGDDDGASHPQIREVHQELLRLSRELKVSWYLPDIKAFLHDFEGEMNERMLCCHSELLAIAFGLISTPPGTPLIVVNSLRVCTDCHTAVKLISRMVNGRKIILRDAHQFHHIEDGVCVCGDYW